MPRTRSFTRLKVRIDEEKQKITDSLLRGDIKSYDEYKGWVGYVRGLTDALRLCDEIEGELD